MRFLFLLVFLMSLILPVCAQSTHAENFRYRYLELGGVGAWQGSGYSSGGLLRYAPGYVFNDQVIAGLSLDVMNLKLDDNTKFIASTLLAYGRYALNDKFSLQVNGGVQTWSCQGCGTKFVAGPSVYYDLSSASIPLLKNLWISYLPIFRDPKVHEIQLGVGLTF